jgi:hypothetical protein
MGDNANRPAGGLADPAGLAGPIAAVGLVLLVVLVLGAMRAGAVPPLVDAMACAVEGALPQEPPDCGERDPGEARVWLVQAPDGQPGRGTPKAPRPSSHPRIEFGALPWVEPGTASTIVVPRTILGGTLLSAPYEVAAGTTVRIEPGPQPGDVSATFIGGEVTICPLGDCRRVRRISRTAGAIAVELDGGPGLDPRAQWLLITGAQLLRNVPRFMQGFDLNPIEPSPAGQLLRDVLLWTSPGAEVARQRMAFLADVTRDLVEFWTARGVAAPDRVTFVHGRDGSENWHVGRAVEVGLRDQLLSGRQRGRAVFTLGHEYGHIVQRLLLRRSGSWLSESEADCLSGYWMGSLRARSRLTAADVADAEDYIGTLTDRGSYPFGISPHPSPEVRLRAFRAGLAGWDRRLSVEAACASG